MQAKTRGRRGPTDHSTWEKVVASKLVHAKVLKQVHDISSREVDPVLRPAPVTSTSPSKATRGTTKNEAQVFEAVISQRNAGLVYAKADRDFGWHADRNPVPLRAAPRRGPKVCLPPKMTTKAEAQKWIARMPPHVPPHTARYEFSMGGRCVWALWGVFCVCACMHSQACDVVTAHIRLVVLLSVCMCVCGSEVAGAMVFAEGGESPRRADRMTTREEADALAATVDAVRHTPVDSKSARCTHNTRACGPVRTPSLCSPD